MPREAVTMGVATILEAREILILATGEHKAHIVRRAVEGEVDHEVAATFLQRHPSTTFYLDSAAGAYLTRVATPWLLGAVEWTTPLAVTAVTWLSRQTQKGILKLTQRDYAEHRLSSLVAAHGTPGALNGLVFNELGAKIRGRSKLPRGRTVICFSPHPDDDVISMGGILRKLVENENAITVAYMTSGNLAVFDHDVRRHLDFLNRVAGERGIAEPAVTDLVRRVESFLAGKHAGEVDIEEVRDIKRVIRESEAVAGLRTLGLEEGAARFLDLPFYQTGKVRKDPIGPADVADRAPAAGGARARPDLRGRRPLRSPRHAPDVQGGDRSGAGRDRGYRPAAARGLALSRRLAGVAGHRGDLARAAVPGGAAAQDPGDLQAPVTEGHRALPGAGRA